MSALDAAIHALGFTDPSIGAAPTADEAEVAEMLTELAALHTPARPDPSGPQMCTGCAAMWPCAGITHAHTEALIWLGRGAARYAAHAEQVWREHETQREAS